MTCGATTYYRRRESPQMEGKEQALFEAGNAQERNTEMAAGRPYSRSKRWDETDQGGFFERVDCASDVCGEREHKRMGNGIGRQLRSGSLEMR